MKEQAKATRKKSSKKYSKILAIPATQTELLAALKITPAELRHARRIVDRVSKRSSTAK